MTPARPGAAWLWVLVAGVAAALHVGKLAPALALLQAELGLTLFAAGVLLSAVQVAGMLGALALGALADTVGPRRSLITGLLLLALASGAGALAPGAAWLLGWRVIEGVGFLLVVLPAPGLLRALVPAAQLPSRLGLWGAYMPLATAMALLLGPAVMAAVGWRGWWLLLAGVCAAAAVGVWRAVPVLPAAPRRAFVAPLRDTLAHGGPWLVGLAFGAYSSQWLAVIGFLPTIYAQAGVGVGAMAVLTAAAAAANIIGNIASGRLLQRGVAAPVLLATGFVTMALAAITAFALPGESAATVALRYAAVLLFSAVGGLIPGTLFSLALRVAPGDHAVASTVGFMQQWSAAGQFAGPPLVAAVAVAVGGWQFTGIATALVAALGLLATAALAARLRRG
ncbi:MAG: MFS transporter [Rubrivivax sp.]|nr:MFS transporter [Rubrivivax sp.]